MPGLVYSPDSTAVASLIRSAPAGPAIVTVSGIVCQAPLPTRKRAEYVTSTLGCTVVCASV